MAERVPSGVYVRARGEWAGWKTIDALDLDDESFRRFVLGHMNRVGIVTALIEQADASADELRAKPGTTLRE